MKFSLQIDTDNDAFNGEDLYEEIARILEHTASRMRREAPRSGVARDINGNVVGEFKIHREDEADVIERRAELVKDRIKLIVQEKGGVRKIDRAVQEALSLEVKDINRKTGDIHVEGWLSNDALIQTWTVLK